MAYGYFLHRQLSLRAELKGEIKGPSKLHLLALRKKYSMYFRVIFPDYKPLFSPRQVLSGSGQFLMAVRKKLGNGKGGLLQREVLRGLAKVSYPKKTVRTGKSGRISFDDYFEGLLDLLASARYRAIMGERDPSFPVILRFFLEAYLDPPEIYSLDMDKGSPFPCSSLDPLPFEAFSLSALSLHISTVRLVCLGERKQMDYIYDLYRATGFFFLFLKAEGIKAERRAVLERWGGWRILLPWGKFYSLALPLSRGIFSERDGKGNPCPYPYNLYEQRRALSRYYLTALAFSRTSEKRPEGISISLGSAVKVRREGKLVLVKFPLEGRSLLLIRDAPLQCDSSLSLLLQEVTAPAPR